MNITLAVFSIIASALIYEDWVTQLRKDWPEESHRTHRLLAAVVLIGLWSISAGLAWVISFLTER
jgi:hypothetical protein